MLLFNVVKNVSERRRCIQFDDSTLRGASCYWFDTQWNSKFEFCLLEKKSDLFFHVGYISRQNNNICSLYRGSLFHSEILSTKLRVVYIRHAVNQTANTSNQQQSLNNDKPMDAQLIFLCFWLQSAQQKVKWNSRSWEVTTFNLRY